MQEFLERWKISPNIYAPPPTVSLGIWRDQAWLHFLVNLNYNNICSNIQFLPRDIFNERFHDHTYGDGMDDPDYWNQNCFVLHLSGTGNEKRYEIIDRITKEIES